MSLERVKSLMKKVAWGAFATTDGKIVGVRPMGGWAWMGDELWCPTSAPSDAEKDRITMSNKKTIKRTAEPVKKMKKEEKKFSLTKSRMKLTGMIPAIVFIVIAIWYFISSLQ